MKPELQIADLTSSSVGGRENEPRVRRRDILLSFALGRRATGSRDGRRIENWTSGLWLHKKYYRATEGKMTRISSTDSKLSRGQSIQNYKSEARRAYSTARTINSNKDK